MHTPPTVLIVDDDPVLLPVYGALLQSAGYSALCASNAKQALQLLEEHKKISVIITDLNLPEVNGLGLLAKLSAAGVSIPSILLTGAGEFTHAQARITGVSAFLVKPIVSEDLLRVLSAVIMQSKEN